MTGSSFNCDLRAGANVLEERGFSHTSAFSSATDGVGEHIKT